MRSASLRAGSDGARTTAAGAGSETSAPNWAARSASLTSASGGAGRAPGSAPAEARSGADGPPRPGDAEIADRPARAMLAVSVGPSSTRAAETSAAPSGAMRPSGVQATRQAAPPRARSGPNRMIVMGPVLLRKDGPILVTKI